MDLGTKQPRLPDVFHQPSLGYALFITLRGLEVSRTLQDALEEKGGEEGRGGWRQEAR